MKTWSVKPPLKPDEIKSGLYIDDQRIAKILALYFDVGITLKNGKRITVNQGQELPKEVFVIREIETKGHSYPALPGELTGINFIKCVSVLQKFEGFNLYFKNDGQYPFQCKDLSGIIGTALGKNLTYINMPDMRIDNPMLDILKQLPNIKSFHLDFSKADDVIIQRLKELSSINAISLAYVGQSSITVKGIDAFASLPLKSVRCAPYPTGPLELAWMRGFAKMSSLKILTLDFSTNFGGSVNDAVVELIAAQNLEKLLLGNQNRLTDAGLESIAKMQSLKEVALSKSSVTEAGLKKLREARPELVIKHDTLPVPPPVKK